MVFSNVLIVPNGVLLIAPMVFSNVLIAPMVFSNVYFLIAPNGVL